MPCHCCKEKAVISHPDRCKEHFLEEFEQRVWRTIEEHEMLSPGDRIAVAASGGKDSLTVLHLLSTKYPVTAIAVDEGIPGYREHTLADLRAFCEERNIPLQVSTYADYAGKGLQEIIAEKGWHPCSVCGTFRRHLLAQMGKPFDVVATGHNADDEAQAVLMNLLKGNTELFARNGPVSGAGAKGFTRRVKPLYFCTEKEVMTYAFLRKLTGRFVECPNASEGYRGIVRDAMNAHLEPEEKLSILRNFLAMRSRLPHDAVALNPCTECGEPCSGEMCKACQYLVQLRAS